MGTKAENETAQIQAQKVAIKVLRDFIACEQQCEVSKADIAQDFASILFHASDHTIVANIRIEADKDFKMSAPAVVKRVPDWCR